MSAIPPSSYCSLKLYSSSIILHSTISCCLVWFLLMILSMHLNFHFLTYGDFSLRTYKQSRHNLVHDYTSSQVREELSLLQTYLQQFWSWKSGNDGHFRIEILHDPNFYDITVSISANLISNIYYVDNVANSGEETSEEENSGEENSDHWPWKPWIFKMFMKYLDNKCKIN